MLDIVMSGWSIVYIKGSQVIILKIYCISLKIDFVSANIADPDEILFMQYSIWVFTPKVHVRRFPVYKMGLVARKPVFGVSEKASFKPVSSAAETS